MDGYYPVFLRIDGKRAVVLGGGPVAARKAGGLLRAGALVTVVSPALCPELVRMAGEGGVTHVARAFRPDDLDGAALVMAATDDPDVNRQACGLASSRGIPANSARPPGAGSFIVPSTISRGGLTIAISTGGGCPALSRRLRSELEGLVGQEYGHLLEFLEEARAALRTAVEDEEARAAVLTKIVESGLVERFRDEGPEAGRRAGMKMLGELVNPLES